MHRFPLPPLQLKMPTASLDNQEYWSWQGFCTGSKLLLLSAPVIYMFLLKLMVKSWTKSCDLMGACIFLPSRCRHAWSLECCSAQHKWH